MLKKLRIYSLIFAGILFSMSVFAASTESLLRQSSDPVAGNPKGKITIVEFFDYQCSYCVSMAGTISSTLRNNPDVRVVFKEFPIRGQLSEKISRAALAANLQGKYFAFHHALMQSAHSLSDEKIFTIAKSVGLNVDKLKQDMNSQAITNQLRRNYQLADELNVTATPAFYIGKTNATNINSLDFELGSMSQRELQNAINSARKSS